MKRMAAVFQGDGWKVVPFMEVKQGDSVVILDEDDLRIAIKDAFRKPVGEAYEGAMTLALATASMEEYD